MLPGSFSDEATDGHRGAFQPRRCGILILIVAPHMPSVAPARVSYVFGRIVFRALYAAGVMVTAIMAINGQMGALFPR